MLDNERLIYKMLLEQKIRLVTSAKLYRSSSVGAYEFPVVGFCEKPMRKNSDVPSTQFPSDRTLASAWNSELTEKVFAASGEEARSRNVFEGYFSCNDPKQLKLSSSHYLTAEYLAAKQRGAAEKQPTAHRVVEASFGEEMLRKNLTDTLLDEGAPDVLIAESVETARLYLQNQQFTGLVYGIASSPEEAARYFFAGCSFVYLSEDFTKELISYLDERIKNYRVAYGEYLENRLKLTELDRRARALDIFDESLLDHACDRTINFLKKKKKAEIKISADMSKEEEKRYRDRDEANARLARRAARESIVLLKNGNGILPLDREKKVALIGEYLEDFGFQNETFAGKPTRERLPIDIARDFDGLDITGYAAGYRRGEGTNEELVSNAARLASGSDCAIVFLSAEQGADELPENQALLVRALIGWNVKVIAVISADRCINTEFAKGCHAVLFTGRGGQESAAAVFDLITGAYAPSGRLTEAVDGAGGYPFGYGLSYGAFEYRDLEIDESGITVIVENKGERDGYAVVQLYLQKDGSIYSEKTLKGFSKEFIKRGDAVRVKIPFTENTFRYYDGGKEKYRTQGGEYRIFVSDSAINDKLKGIVKIAADDGRQFTNTVAEAAADGSKTAFTETRGLKERKGIPFGWKLFLAISLFVYYNAVMGLLLFAPFVPLERTILFYALVGAFTGLIDLAIVAFIVFISLKRQKEYIPVNDVLSDMVDKVDEFVQIAKLTYPDPIKEKEAAESKEADNKKNEEEKAEEERKAQEKETQEQTQREEETREENKKSGSLPSIDKPSDYPEAESFEKMCGSFRRFVMNCGINLGVSSSRKVLAAIAASRLVLISSKNTELLPEFMQAVNGYFGGLGFSVAEDNWNTAEDILWQEVSGRNTYSVFTSSVVDTSRRHNKNAVALIGNVSAINLSDWFGEMIDFAATPTEEHFIVLNDETKFSVPQNLCCLLFTQENGLRSELMREIVDASLQIEVSIRRAEDLSSAEDGTGNSERAVSYPNFCALVRGARENYYLSEKNWAKIDLLFEQLNANERIPLGNKNTLQAEKYTSVLMSCGADEGKALECLFLAKIVPLLKTSRAYAQEGGETAIYDLIRKIFAEEDLTKVQKVLSERPVKVEGKSRNTFFTPGYREEENSYEEETVEARADETVGGAEFSGSTKSAETEEVISGSGVSVSAEEFGSVQAEIPMASPDEKAEPFYEAQTATPVYDTAAENYTTEEIPVQEAQDFAPDYDASQNTVYQDGGYQEPVYDGNDVYGGAADQYNYDGGYESYGNYAQSTATDGVDVSAQESSGDDYGYADGVYQNNEYSDFGNNSSGVWSAEENDGGDKR